MKTKIYFLLLVVLGLFFLNFESVEACTCVRGNPQCESIPKDKVIFVGKVTKIEQVRGTGTFNSKQYEYWYNRISFNVEEVFGSQNVKQLFVATSTSTASCGYKFKESEKYLVYSYKDKETGKLSTTLCSGTQSFAEAKNEIKLLRQVAGGNVQNQFFGKVKYYPTDTGEESTKTNQTAFEVVARSIPDGKIFVTKTDENGLYRLTGLPTGLYRIAAYFDNNLKKEFKDYRLSKLRKCWNIDFYLQKVEVLK